jgi:hypothetical protein
MEAIALLGVYIFFSMLLRWFVAHDKAPDEKTRGLFAMREPEETHGDQTSSPGRREPRAPRVPVISAMRPISEQN